jgi:hypothetical protein
VTRAEPVRSPPGGTALNDGYEFVIDINSRQDRTSMLGAEPARA